MNGIFCLLKKKITPDEFHHCVVADNMRLLASPGNTGRIYAKVAAFLSMFYVELNGDEYYRVIAPADDGLIFLRIAELVPAEQFLSILNTFLENTE